MIIRSFIGRPTRAISFTKMPLKKVQCSRKSRCGATPSGSSMSIKGIAYLDKLAVKMTTSQYLPHSTMNSQQPGRTYTQILQVRPSISIGKTMSALLVGENDECTNVSSMSSIKVFRPLNASFYGLSKKYLNITDKHSQLVYTIPTYNCANLNFTTEDLLILVGLQLLIRHIQVELGSLFCRHICSIRLRRHLTAYGGALALSATRPIVSMLLLAHIISFLNLCHQAHCIQISGHAYKDNESGVT